MFGKNMLFTLCSICIFAFIYSLQVIPERAAITYVNERYMSNVSTNVRRYIRRGNYYLNVEGTIKQAWGNNISVHLIFYEYLHNEYKRSFVEMHFKACDMLKSDPYIGKAINSATKNVVCPTPAGRYALMNMTIPGDDFPNVWPFEKSKVEVIIQQTPTNDIMGKGELYAIFKQSLAKNTEKKKL